MSELEHIWLYYWEHKGQYWDTLDDIEDALSWQWHCTSKEANKNMVSQYKDGARSKYKKGELPSDWTKHLKGDVK